MYLVSSEMLKMNSLFDVSGGVVVVVFSRDFHGNTTFDAEIDEA